MDKINKLFLFFSLLALGVAGCATVPLTGRRQISFIPASEMVTLSATNYKEIISQSKLSQDAGKVGMIKRVGTRITQAAESFLTEKGLRSDLQYYHWEFNLIDDDKTVNAFCMPGGEIAFYTGIMKLATSEDYVAVVMGHEVAHAIAKHGNERMSQMVLVQLGGVALDTALAKKPEETRNIFLSAFGLGTQVGVLLPYSRKHEYEADEIGLVLMAKAGYPPESAIGFWEKMKLVGGSRPPEFLSTHPSSSARIENMKKLLPKARQYFQPVAK